MFSNKFLDKLHKVSSQRNLADRSDMYVSDVRHIDDIKCAVLVGFSENLGNPTPDDISRFVHDEFGGRVVAQMSSAKILNDDSAVYLVLSANAPTRPYSDINDMVMIASSMYSEPGTNHIWAVVDSGTNKYLMRQVGENIGDIVAARKQMVSRHQPRFATTKSVTAALMVESGDTVKFMSPQNAILHGVVSSTSGDKVVVSANGSSYTVSKDAVLQIVDRPSSVVNKEKNVLKDYFSKAFGDPSYAELLTKKLSVEEHGLGDDVGPTKGK